MKRIFLLKGLDCPNCSAKIEKEVGELDGVQSSVVNLMKQTLTINVAQTAADTIASQSILLINIIVGICSFCKVLNSNFAFDSDRA